MKSLYCQVDNSRNTIKVINNCSNTTRHPGDVKITSDETGRNIIEYYVKLNNERKLK